MKLKPHGQIDLPARAHTILGNRQVTLVYAESGQAFVLDLARNTATALPGVSSLRCVSIHAHQNYVGGLDGHGRWTLHPATTQSAAPRIDPSVAPWSKQPFEQCLFDADGRHLWLATRAGPSAFEVFLIETIAWSLVSRQTLQDEIGGSSCLLLATGRPGVVSLWLAAGQDGQQMYWLLKTAHGCECRREPQLVNTTPPVFSPDGTEFLALTEENGLAKFEFDTMRHVSTLFWTEDDVDCFATSMCYLDSRSGLASTNENRIFSIDTGRMTLGGELALEGHEPRPIGEYYPNLAHEPGISTDIQWFVRVGDVVFFVFRRDKGRGAGGWQDSLAWTRCSVGTLT